jgi:hypothetical protein
MIFLLLLQITKNRFDGELGVMLLKFDKDSLSFAVKDKPHPRQRFDQDTADHTEEPGLTSRDMHDDHSS